MDTTKGNGLTTCNSQPAKELTYNAIDFTATPTFKTTRQSLLETHAPANTLQKDRQMDAVGLLIFRLGVALNVDPLRIVDAIHEHGHPGQDGTNLDKALGLPMGSAARAMRSITGGDGLPVAHAVAKQSRDGVWRLTVTCCPFCGQRHHHGGNNGPLPGAGSRVADCGGGQYELVEVAP